MDVTITMSVEDWKKIIDAIGIADNELTAEELGQFDEVEKKIVQEVKGQTGVDLKDFSSK